MATMRVMPYGSALSSYSSRTVVLEVSGMSCGAVHQRTGSSYTVTVSYGSLSQTLQGLHRLGGQVVSVMMPSFPRDGTEMTGHDRRDASAVAASSVQEEVVSGDSTAQHQSPSVSSTTTVKPVASKRSTKRASAGSTRSNQQTKKAPKQRSKRKHKS